MAQLRMVGRLVDGVEASAGEAILEQSTRSYQFVIIEEGEVQVLRDGAQVAILGPGEFFGELAILDGGSVRSASVIARTPLRALALTSHYLHQIREHIPLVRERIDHEVRERVARNANAAESTEV